METKEQRQVYLEHVSNFLATNFDDHEILIDMIKKTEPAGRVTYMSKEKGFGLGMAIWPIERIAGALKEIQAAISDIIDYACKNDAISEGLLTRLNEMSHDLKIRYHYDETIGSRMKLGYHVPDSRLAWEEGKCPHCGEAVTLQIFPDPIPLFAYDAVINALRLLSRHVKIRKCKGCDKYFLPDKVSQVYHTSSCRGSKR